MGMGRRAHSKVDQVDAATIDLICLITLASEVAKQLKLLAAETGLTQVQLVAECLNMVFAKQVAVCGLSTRLSNNLP
jgi:Antitoxin-like ribbon-helix-helix